MIDYQLNTRLNGNLAMTFCFHENKALQLIQIHLGAKRNLDYGNRPYPYPAGKR